MFFWGGGVFFFFWGGVIYFLKSILIGFARLLLAANVCGSTEFLVIFGILIVLCFGSTVL